MIPTPLPATAHALMDGEHRTLMDWVHEAVQRLQAPYSTDEAVYAVDVLCHLARSHFEHERVEMCAMDYPECSAHAQDHLRLIEELSRLRRDIVTSGGGDSGEGHAALRQRLAAWMRSHVDDHDRRYANWLRQRTPTPAAHAPRPGLGRPQLK